MPLKNIDSKIEGISGPDKICTLPAFEILEIIGEPDEPPTDPDPVEPEPPDDPIPSPPKPPQSGGTKEYLEWLMRVIEWFKKHFN